MKRKRRRIARARFFEGDWRLAERWPYSADPAIYLSRWPEGPHATLAREITQEIVADYLTRFNASMAALEDAFRVLAQHLGWQLHDYPPDRGTTHSALKELLQKSRPSMDLTVLRSGSWREVRRLEVTLRRRLVRDLGVRLRGYGTLGPPQDWPVRPKYWKGKKRPSEFLWSHGRALAGREKILLAKAAVSPFEDAIAEELQVVERALRATLKPGPEAEAVYKAAIDVTWTKLAFTRYPQLYSIEFYGALTDWAKTLSLDEAAPPFPRVGDMPYARGSQSQTHSE